MYKLKLTHNLNPIKGNYQNNNNSMEKAHTYVYPKNKPHPACLPFALLTLCWHKQVKSNKNILFSEFIL